MGDQLSASDAKFGPVAAVALASVAVPVPAVTSVTAMPLFTFQGTPAVSPVSVTTDPDTVAVISEYSVKSGPPPDGRTVAVVSVKVSPSQACFNVVATCAVVTNVPIVTNRSFALIVTVIVSPAAHVSAIVIVLTSATAPALPSHRLFAIKNSYLITRSGAKNWPHITHQRDKSVSPETDLKPEGGDPDYFVFNSSL